MTDGLEEKAKIAFGDHAAAMAVPVEVVMAAAAHTFNMLDDDQQVELVEEALARWSAAQKTLKAVEQALASEPLASAKQLTVQLGSETVVYSNERNQMRDDLIYKLMHQRFDVIYAVAVRLDDAPEGPEHQQWLMTPQRPDEKETPNRRVAVLLQGLIEAMRKSRQRFESLRSSALARASKEKS